MRFCLFTLLCVVSIASKTPAAEPEFRPLFNGRDLSGWVVVNVAPNTFMAKDGMIVSTGEPTGVMRTEKQYENFILELEWRHMKPGGNAGVFVWGDPLPAVGIPFTRGIEVQVLDGRTNENYTSHGDVFAIHGAVMTPDRPHPMGWPRCLPSEHRAKPSPEWNHYRVVCNHGTLKLSVNGKEVSGGTACKPRSGYLHLESEGSECHFRNVKITELPSTNPASDEVAEADQGFRPLFTGLDLTRWKADAGHQNHWTVAGGKIRYDGKSEAKDKNLWSEKEFGDFMLVCDWRLSAKPQKLKRPVILPTGDYEMRDGKQVEVEVDDAGDSGIYLRGNSKSQINIWCWPVGSGEVYGYRTDAKQPASVRAGVTPKVRADKPLGQWNRFVVTMKGERLTVVLNGQTVLDHAELPGVPARGPIALQHHGDAIEFTNIFVKEL